jgi:hypothetical protein
MAILIDTDSEEAKERRKWEQHQSVWGPPGNPYRFRPFPAMLYKARQIPSGMPGAGKWATGMERPAKVQFATAEAWDNACQAVEVFVRSCQMIVNNDEEYKRAKEAGWCDTAPLAEEAAQLEQKKIGDETAERNYRDRMMSEKAKAEVAEYEAENFGHQPEIPVAKKRGRPRKEAAA